MIRILPSLIALLFMTVLYSCQKETNNTALCNNGILDGNETEIDCGGGACSSCPPAGAFSCEITGVAGLVNYTCTNAYGQELGPIPSVRVFGTDAGGIPFNFMFIPSILNQPLPIIQANFNYGGESYTCPFDSSNLGPNFGSITVIAKDTLRHIISGTFSFNAHRTTGAVICTVDSGVFTNIRYH